MGQLISLEDHRAAREARPRARDRIAGVELHFDLADPFAYLAAERVERTFESVTWTPVTGVGEQRRGTPEARMAAATRADALRVPLVWPERFPAPVPGAMRAAALAVESGRGAEFALAASRLAFCGGFDLDDPEILAEAAAAAGIGLDACLAAAGDRGRDAAMAAAGRRLAVQGIDRLPVLRVGRAVFAGEERIAEAAAAARCGAAALN